MIYALICLPAGGFIIDFLLHIFIFGLSAKGLFFSSVTGLCFGLGLLLIAALLPKKIGYYISGALLLADSIWAASQLVYYKVFGTLMQLSVVSMGGDAISEYYKIVINTILKNIVQILLLLLPAVLFIVFAIKHRLKIKLLFKGKILAICAVFVAAVILTFSGSSLGQKSDLSPADIFNNNSYSVDINYQRLGTLGAIVKELKIKICGAGSSEIQQSAIESGEGTYNSEEYNICNVDFEELAKNAESEELKSVYQYISSLKPTNKNQYTGLLEGYNVITICAESFCPYFISEELTPALYKLSNNGFIFENYYGSYQSLTSNGEYTMCLGLYPNMVNTSEATSFEDSIGNYLPYTLANALKSKGYSAYAYHNNVGDFYARNKTHANMGYTFKAAGSGLDIKLLNPSSDLEMFKQSVDDLISGENFTAHYMTWSAHNPYNWTNPMAEKNKDAVSNLSYSENVKAYIACNLEFEYGLEYLLEKLEEAGVADKTIIVITNDHVPYGLTQDELNELAGSDVSGLNRFKNSFICYVPGIKEAVSTYCSTADILPTLLNLLGVEYDSRLLAGKDIFSDCTHVAVIGNQSFITEEFTYNASLGKVADNTVKDTNGYTEADYLKYIENLFTFSNQILDLDLYAEIFGQEGLVDSDIVEYQDIENVFHKAAVQFITDYKLMDADSETQFGGNRQAQVSELISVLQKLNALMENSDGALLEPILLKDDFAIDENLTHLNCAVLFMRFAEYKGIEIGSYLDEIVELKEKYPDVSEEVLRAAVWASEEAVINKQTEYILTSQAEGLTRFQLAAYISYLSTHEFKF